MTKFLFFSITVLALIILLSSQTLAQPKMYMAEESFDFGFAPQNCKVTHIFWIKSVGDDTLKIIDVKPG